MNFFKTLVRNQPKPRSFLILPLSGEIIVFQRPKNRQQRSEIEQIRDNTFINLMVVAKSMTTTFQTLDQIVRLFALMFELFELSQRICENSKKKWIF